MRIRFKWVKIWVVKQSLCNQQWLPWVWVFRARREESHSAGEETETKAVHVGVLNTIWAARESLSLFAWPRYWTAAPFWTKRLLQVTECWMLMEPSNSISQQCLLVVIFFPCRSIPSLTLGANWHKKMVTSDRGGRQHPGHLLLQGLSLQRSGKVAFSQGIVLP